MHSAVDNRRPIEIARMRNIGLVAHIDAGKTTTSERILFYTGRSTRLGEVDEGSATMDWMHSEQTRGISITAASTSCIWADHRINLIDTPGHVDFTVEVERCLRVLDGAVGIFSAVEGVQSQSETVWKQSDRYGVPRLAFINKMDRMGADLDRCISQIRERLDAAPVLVQWPIGNEDTFRGLVDLVEMRALLWTQDDSATGSRFRTIEIAGRLLAEAEAARKTLIEALAEVDDELMARYLDGKTLSPAELKAALRRATLQHRAVPVLCGAARHNKGIQPLLDAIVDYLPSPLDVAAVTGLLPNGETTQRSPVAGQPFAALAFKIQHHPAVGPLTYFRVYSGRVDASSTVYNATKGRREPLGRLVQMHASSYEDVHSVSAGDIGAAIGLRSTSTGDTLCDERAPILLESIRVATPVVSQALEPRSDDDAARLQAALTVMTHEDPTLQLGVDTESGRPLVRGMGELHLEVVVERLRREFNLEVGVGRPMVAYLETVKQPAQATFRLVRQVGGRGQFAEATLAVQALPTGEGVRFVDARSAAAIADTKLPREFVVAIERGVRDAMSRGTLAGFAMTDIEVRLCETVHSWVDSSPQAFEIAGFEAFRQACRTALPILLEPVMDLSVSTPDSFLGQVIGDLSSRRGKILGMEAEAGHQTVSAQAPLDELFGYATRLRSMTQGKATHSMELSHYAAVPIGISDGIVGRTKS